MTGLSATTLVAVTATSITVALAARVALPPRPRLARRVRPYAAAARSSLGRGADREAIGSDDGGFLRQLARPSLEATATRLGRLVDGTADEVLALRLDQAGLLSHLPRDRRVGEYRIRQLAATAVGGAAGVGLALVSGRGSGALVALGSLGLVMGATRWRGRLDRALQERRERLRMELYTVNQLIAMSLRVGGGIVQAIQRVVERGRGELVTELAELLRAHTSGVPLQTALQHAAATSPEPTLARTYRLLAAGAEHWADLADALLAHSDDLREARREALRRSATRRRAGMLVPIIGVLAPVMLLFIAAPLPSIVFGVR